MNNNWKKTMIGVAAVAIIASGTLILDGCNSAKDTQVELPDPVENFTIDFESGDFSFDFDDTAKQFYVRVYEQGSEEGSMPVAARQVR